MVYLSPVIDSCALIVWLYLQIKASLETPDRRLMTLLWITTSIVVIGRYVDLVAAKWQLCVMLASIFNLPFIVVSGFLGMILIKVSKRWSGATGLFALIWIVQLFLFLTHWQCNK